ncbi:MAG: hypothetical protein OXI24_17840 [Candidatus Poribacteria bacterium]|nr:hypothetical protein [Candidatus Poribacteria bacterium]
MRYNMLLFLLILSSSLLKFRHLGPASLGSVCRKRHIHSAIQMNGKKKQDRYE